MAMMKEKVVELLTLLLSEMGRTLPPKEIDWGDLKNRGYSQSEINAAVTWLSEHTGSVERGSASSTWIHAGSRRVLHEVERTVLSTDAQGELIQLSELGLLDDRDREAVLERAVVSGYENISVGELRELVAAVLFAREGKALGAHPSGLTSEDTVH
jgi:uncharacterized protein Smg (DUF494 family)